MHHLGLEMNPLRHSATESPVKESIDSLTFTSLVPQNLRNNETNQTVILGFELVKWLLSLNPTDSKRNFRRFDQWVNGIPAQSVSVFLRFRGGDNNDS